MYSISHLAYYPDMDIDWSVTGDLSIEGVARGGYITVNTTSQAGSGSGTIKAIVHNGTCGDYVIVKNISTGLTGLPPINGPTTIFSNSINTYSVDAVPGSTNFHWDMSPGPPDFTPTDGYSNSSIQFFTSYPGSYYLVLSVQKACGTEYQTIGIQVNDDRGGFGTFAAYPNPAGRSMTISTSNMGSSPSAANSNSTAAVKKRDFSYKMYDKKGKVLKQGASNKGDDVIVDTHDVPADTYFLHVMIDKKETQKQIIIKH